MKQRLKERSSHPTKRHSCGAHLWRRIQWWKKADRDIVRTSSELKRPWGSDRAQLLPEPNGSPGRSSPHISAHRAAIQLPERSHTQATQSTMTIPELPGQNSWGDAVPFQPATDSQTAKGNMRRRHRQQSAFKRRPSIRRRVDLHSIRLQLLEQLA